MKKKRRELKEDISKEFLMNLLAPFLPTIHENEQITDIDIETELDTFKVTYVIMKGGVH